MENQSSVERVSSARLCGGTIQLRQSDDSLQLIGQFPYNTIGRIHTRRRETLKAGAFNPLDNGEVHLLLSHDYGKPLARTRDDSLVLSDTPEALTFTATMPSEQDMTSWQRDAVIALKNGLIDGLSPGFLIRPGGISHRGDLQIINAAVLRELSIVTRPVYTSHAAIRAQERRYDWIQVL